VSFAAAFGNFKGASGLAAGLGWAVSDRFRLNAAFSGSPDINAYGVVVGGSFTLN
jgi:trimeric autotransporter adhesin